MVGQTEIVNVAMKYVEQLLNERSPDTNVYHDFAHTYSVVEECMRMAEDGGLGTEESEILYLAGWFHDIGYIQGQDGHEERSVEVSDEFLNERGYSQEKIERVAKCVLATKMPQNPHTTIEKILCDADLSNLGMDTYREKSTLIRREWELNKVQSFDEKSWVEFEIDFLTKHSYFTPQAKSFYGEQKKKNLDFLISKDLKDQNNDVMEKPKSKKKISKEPTRGVETMFRTAYRTHINLSSIADNKANILLSINAIIISITLTALLPKIDNNPYLLLPSLVLLTVCILTIIYATLSTRPKITSGRFSKEDIHEKKSNLLFFGNFHNMEVDEFEWGMNEMMKDKDFLYGSMSRDLYYLGKVLAKKYHYLRIGYSIFMFGLIISVISFAIAIATIP